MVEIDDERRDRYLTVGWNNLLTAALGIPAVAIGVGALASSTVSDRTAFFAVAGIGAVY